MRNLGIALIAAAALCLAAPAFADRGDGGCEGNPHNCQGGGGGGGGGGGAPGASNTNTNQAGALGLGIGIGEGGNARATGGNSSSRSGAAAGAGVFGSGNSSNSNSNRNSNDSSARVGNVGAFSGVDFGRADIGNSTNDLSNRNRNRNSVDTNTSTSTSTSTSNQQGQGQGQQQGLTDNSSVSITDSSDNSTFVEAADIPVASAAPVFASACSAGVSGQSMGFGGSLATTNPMCDMALAAEMARAVGNDELAYELTIEAATFARARTNIVRRFGQWIPFVGSLW